MTVKNKTNKNYKRSQKGRSMVEMLGVLAIVGVLSVGGVYGYGVAMKKHKANELLHQASMLATTISAQAMTNDGNLPQTITDFGNSGYTTTLTDNGTKFILTMKDVDSAVCDQLKEGGMVQGVECVDSATSGKKDAKITYYKNLATTEAEGEKSPTGGETVECSGHGYKDSNDTCICATGYSGTDCSTTLCASGETYCGDNSGTPICCDNGTEVCSTGGTSSGTCFKAESGCTTNADCTNPDEPWCNLGAADCTPSAGTCTALDEGTPSTEVKDGDGNTVFRAGQFLIGPEEMYWFAAQNWCRAHGKELVRLSTFKISTPNDKWVCDLPCGSSESCAYQNDYDGTSDTASAVCKPLGSSSIMDINDAYYGKLLGYMRAAIGTTSYYWTADDYDSCSPFGVDLYDGGVVTHDRSGGAYALCE